MKQVAKEKWGRSGDPFTSLEKKLNLCLHDGDEKASIGGFCTVISS
ncbi:hypothetical protein ACLBOM_11440 [Escherichia coli]